MFVPVLFPYIRGGQAHPLAWVGRGDEPKAHPKPENVFPDFQSKAEQNSPSVLKDSSAQNTNTHQWSYMPKILRIPQSFNRRQWDGALANSFHPSSTHGRTPSTCTHDNEMERTMPSAVALIFWLKLSPGSLEH